MDIHQKYHFPFAPYPAVRLVLLLITGILLDYHFTISTIFWACAFVIFALLYISSELFYQKTLRKSSYELALCCYIGMIIAFGGSWHSFFDYRQPPPEATVINSYTWEELTFQGNVQQIKQTSTGKYQIDVDVDITIFPDEHGWAKSYDVRAVLSPDDLSFPKQLKIGSSISFSATVYPLEEKQNPGQFDYKQYLTSIGIYSQVGITEIINIETKNSTLSWTFFRQKVLKAIEHNFSEQTAPLAKALLIGYKNELAREDKIAFSRAGLSHIMAVSGLHVGFILAPFWLFIPLFWSLRYGKQIGLVLLISFLIFYAGLTGFSASVTRASLVGGFLAYGKLFHKVRDSKNLTAVAALIILLINPGDLFAIGFQLSFAAVYVILLTTPVISRQLSSWIRYRWYGQPVMVVIISFIVQVGLFPLLAYHFGEFSLVGPLANAFVVPFLGIAVPLALILLPVSGLFPHLAQILNLPIDYFLRRLDWFVNTTASWPWSWIQVHIDSILFFGIWITSIFLIATLRIPRMRWKMLILLLCLLSLDQGNKLIQNIKPAPLQITIYDVGQGDAALINTPNNKHFLVDVGRWQPDYNSAKYVIIPHLKSRGIDKLDAVFLSHPHADHIGGIVELIQEIPIDTIYNSGASYDSQLYQNYKRKSAQKNIPIVSLSAGDKVALDTSIKLFTYGPTPGASASNVNNHSLILELIYGETEFLFMGDAEQSQEKRLVENYPELADTDFLKVGHHGSKTSSTASFLKSATAEIGIVSLGRRNQFQHPHPQAVRRLKDRIRSIYFTSLNNALIFESNGDTIQQKNWKE